jgi:hypothetical protein
MRGTAIGWLVLGVLGLAATPATAALPTVTVKATTSPLTIPGQTVSASCPAGAKLVGGGSSLRTASDGLMLGATMASTGASPDVAAPGGSLDPASWTGIATSTGAVAAGDQATTFALCATGATARTSVAGASRTGQNAAPETEAAIVTTATCPAGSQLIGGGSQTRAGGGDLHPLASYPSNAAGVPAANGSTAATSWSGSGAADVPADSDEVLVYALCSFDALPVEVARTDAVFTSGVLTSSAS